MEEVWKDVVGYEEIFKISNFGRLFSKRTNKVLKPFLHKNGYYIVATKIGGRSGVNRTFKVHRLVAEAFLEAPTQEILDVINCTKYKVVPVNHKDGNKLNNHAGNLEWCTPQENYIHALELGLIDNSKKSGANSPQSFFKTEVEREKAYRDFKESGLSMRKFAKTLGVTHSVLMALKRDYGKCYYAG